MLDGLDGRIARLLDGASKFGAELDSLSDFISFGVAPALLLYYWCMRGVGGIGWVLTMLVVGTNLAIHLFLIWRGQPTDTLSMAVLAVAALYLNQSDVRRAFGIGAGRIETALARSDEAAREPA